MMNDRDAIGYSYWMSIDNNTATFWFPPNMPPKEARREYWRKIRDDAKAQMDKAQREIDALDKQS